MCFLGVQLNFNVLDVHGFASLRLSEIILFTINRPVAFPVQLNHSLYHYSCNIQILHSQFKCTNVA